MADVEVGEVVGIRAIEVTRGDLVHYAGASGDRNPIHWNERFAREVGLPGVIAHGMFTMALAVNVVVDWLGDPGRVLEYGVRFTRPVQVPDPGGATVTITATVGAVDPDAGTARVDLVAEAAGVKVLGRAQAVVRL
ncbi:MAG: MaoC family dehydratase [Actinomycetales bacterium]|nr:MaoC family dehydratase [Actinomycetales bacterium]